MKRVVPVSIALVTVAAFALSFQSLTKLGELAGYEGLAWLYPLCVDLGTVSSCAAWLVTRSRQAFWMTWSLLVISVLQNGAVHWLIATKRLPEWWLVTLVATVPPLVLGLTMHLGVTLGKEQAEEARAAREAAEKAAARAEERAEAKRRAAEEAQRKAAEVKRRKDFVEQQAVPPTVAKSSSEWAKLVAEQQIEKTGKPPSVRELAALADVGRGTAERALVLVRSTG